MKKREKGESVKRRKSCSQNKGRNERRAQKKNKTHRKANSNNWEKQAHARKNNNHLPPLMDGANVRVVKTGM